MTVVKLNSQSAQASAGLVAVPHSHRLGDGNHEVQGRQVQHIEKGEFSAEEGLVLRHRRSGQRLLVVHDHQIDVWSDQLGWLSQELVWLMHQSFNWLGLKAGDLAADRVSQKSATAPHHGAHPSAYLPSAPSTALLQHRLRR